MTQPSSVHTGSAPPAVQIRTAGPQRALRWLCTSNPFYVISAGLFLAGLRLSFGDPGQADNAWALIAWLAGYILLLAGTAFLLVRFGNVWDDVRTVLLLIVLMFLATSVTFDEVLVFTPDQGLVCNLIGLLFAVVVSEGLLRGTGLRLPALFRMPYYLILALFFLYPLLLAPLVHQPRSDVLMWSLFGFAPAAGLVFLTLIPAIRRGRDVVRANGSPWPWPLYPWTLFGMLALAVPARAFLLCWSLHLVEGGPRDQVIFGPYFLVPFGLALGVLFIEFGLQARSGGLLKFALLVPAALTILATVGHRSDPIYEQFLARFISRLGGTPFYLTVLASLVFYGYAILRRVPLAAEALTAALAALAFVGPRTLNFDQLIFPQAWPLLALAILQLTLGIWRRSSGHCLLGGLVGVAALALFPGQPALANFRVPILFHVGLIIVLLVGAAFDDPLGRFLRGLGALLVLIGCLVAIFVPLPLPADLPSWSVWVYPPAMGLMLAGYGLLLRHAGSVAVAGLILLSWLIGAGVLGYRYLRHLLVGLDYIALSIAMLVLGILMSLVKSGHFGRRPRAEAQGEE